MDYYWTEPQYMCYLGIVDVVTVSENHHIDIFMTFIVDIFHTNYNQPNKSPNFVVMD